MKTVVIMASTVKEAKEIALKNYGESVSYLKPYRYASKGNNFYEFVYTIITKPRKKKRQTVEFEGNIYSLKSNKIVVPDFSTMTRSQQLWWIYQNAVPKGYSKGNPLAGLAGAIKIN